MALDPLMNVMRQDTQELSDRTREALERGWSVGRRDLECVTLISCREPSGSHDTEKREIGSFDGWAGRSPYEILDSWGIIAVAGDASAGDITLSGGSVSQCLLRHKGGGWFVIKRTTGLTLPSIDSWDRHVLEAEFVSTLNTNGNLLFPSCNSSGGGGVFEATMPFVPAYTLGELFIQRRLAMPTLTQKVCDIFRSLESTLYCRESIVAQETYVEKVDRRLSLLLNKTSVHNQVESLYRLGCRINGRDCRPIREMLELIGTDPDCQAVLRSDDPRLCHGDLILDDILCLASSNRCVLIDPNPQNTDPLVDLSKMAMSGLIAYDLAIRDWIRYECVRAIPKVVAEVGVPSRWESLEGEQVSIGEWVCKNGRSLVSPDVLPNHRAEPRAIKLIAGLQAMAIPAFHALHRKRDERALYFLAKGLLITEAALAEYGI